MIDDRFKIYIHRLSNGKQEKIQETFSPEFMDIDEADLKFQAPVVVQGEAEVAEQTLVLRLSVETEATIPCSICNADVQFKLKLNSFCYTIDITEIKGGIFFFNDVLREAILLELPLTTECKGNCPERQNLVSYFSKKQNKEEFHPFEDLD